MAAPSMDTVVKSYMKLRDQKDAIKREAKTKVDELDASIEKLETWILSRMETDGVTSYKTEHGTAFRTTTDYVTVADWDAVLDFVKKEDAYHLLEKRVSKAAVLGYMNDPEDKRVPPGVNYYTRADINIRRPTR